MLKFCSGENFAKRFLLGGTGSRKTSACNESFYNLNNNCFKPFVTCPKKTSLNDVQILQCVATCTSPAAITLFKMRRMSSTQDAVAYPFSYKLNWNNLFLNFLQLFSIYCINLLRNVQQNAINHSLKNKCKFIQESFPYEIEQLANTSICFPHKNSEKLQISFPTSNFRPR